MQARLIAHIHYLCRLERSPKVLAQSMCLGLLTALSPYMGLHSILSFVGAWILRLNGSVAFVTCHVVNNPWTVGPIVLSQYFLGRWIVLLCGFDHLLSNPVAIRWLLDAVRTLIPVPRICFWSFMIGSHLMAVIVTAILYPILYRVISNILVAEEQEFIAAQPIEELPQPVNNGRKPQNSVNERI